MGSAIALQSLFEGLFVRALTPSGAFKERLRAKGFDPDRMQPRYPLAVWVDCVDVAIEELFPGVPRDEGWSRVGATFVEGYFGTLVGKMISTTLPFMSARTFVARSPRFITTGLEGARLDLTWEDETRARLAMHGAGSTSGYLMVGVFRACFQKMKVDGVQLRARELPDDSGEVHVTLP